MSYIGQVPIDEFVAVPTKDVFTGDGSTTTFDLAASVASGSVNALDVFIDNVRQEPGSGKAFTLGVDGSNNMKRITFTSAPASSAAIYVLNPLTNTQSIAPLPTDLNGVELILDADGDTSITADTDDRIDFRASGADQIQLADGAFKPVTDSDVDLGTSSLYFKNAWIDAITTTGNVTVGGDLTITGTTSFADTNITNVGSIALDTITNDGTDITLDSGGDIILDADGTQIYLKDGGTTFGSLTQTGGELVIKSSSSDTTALTFAGANATFAGTLGVAGIATFTGVPVLPANTIDSAHYVDGSIDNEHIADDAIDSEHYAAGSIDTAHIADDQVTLAKMDGLARGKIIYGNASGNPTALTVGSSGQALVSDGTDISWGSGGAIATYSNSTNNRVLTSVDSSSVNSEANLTFDGSVLAATGNITATGTMEPAGDTAANDNAAIGYTSAEGLILTGQGSTNDVTIKNDADADVIKIPTGTTNVTIVGNLTTAAGGIATASLADDAVTAAKMADNSVDSDSYVDGSIDNAHIADDAIDSEHYADGSIDNAHIADDAIDSEHYADGSIDNAHIADDAIDSEHYADGSIDNAHIADDQINSEHYAAASIDNEHLADDAVGVAELSASGTASSSTFLRGDNSWVAPSGGATKKMSYGSMDFNNTAGSPSGNDSVTIAAAGGSGILTGTCSLNLYVNTSPYTNFTAVNWTVSGLSASLYVNPSDYFSLTSNYFNGFKFSSSTSTSSGPLRMNLPIMITYSGGPGNITLTFTANTPSNGWGGAPTMNCQSRVALAEYVDATTI